LNGIVRLPDADIVFVIDEDAGPHVARGITDAGGRVVMVTEEAGAGAKDRQWIPLARTWGSAIITRDCSMRRTPAETQALLSSGCHAFILRAGNLKLDELYALAKDNYGAMLRFVATGNTPFLATVSKNGIKVVTQSGRRGGPKQPR
jgi:predicted nuclease of predicted toxin-antitoxin system